MIKKFLKYYFSDDCQFYQVEGKDIYTISKGKTKISLEEDEVEDLLKVLKEWDMVRLGGSHIPDINNMPTVPVSESNKPLPEQPKRKVPHDPRWKPVEDEAAKYMDIL